MQSQSPTLAGSGGGKLECGTPARRAGSLQAKRGRCRRMRHFLAGILNCAAPLVAVIPAIFVLPSGWPDFAASISSGRGSLREVGDTIPAQRNDIFSPRAVAKRAPSIAPDLVV